MIAFLGLLLYVAGVPRNIYLIDEPDVYLHPPQAYAAGSMILRQSSAGQLFIATHNAHFLRGVLDGRGDRVVLVRLDRSRGEQEAKLVDAEVFNEARNDPLLRFTPLLEAIFFRNVVICEDESDCLFYRALLEALGFVDAMSPVFWISSHGKQGIPKIAKLLRSLGVKVFSIADCDVINREDLLQALVEAHGGAWAEFIGDFSTVRSLFESRKPTNSAGDVKRDIGAILGATDVPDSALFPDKAQEAIRDVLRRTSPWRELKETGLKALSSGTVMNAGKRLLETMAGIGLLIVETGETERFCPSIGGHGIAWVEQVLRRDLASDPELAEARVFASKLAKALALTK